MNQLIHAPDPCMNQLIHAPNPYRGTRTVAVQFVMYPDVENQWSTSTWSYGLAVLSPGPKKNIRNFIFRDDILRKVKYQSWQEIDMVLITRIFLNPGFRCFRQRTGSIFKFLMRIFRKKCSWWRFSSTNALHLPKIFPTFNREINRIKFLLIEFS